ncbi:MAG: hypothetical protein ABI036_16175 [Fibrobacteria bacterium]
MLDIGILREYRAFLEYRILLALEKRSIEYRADVTKTLTGGVCALGSHEGYSITLEKRYHPILTDIRNRRCDVHWHGTVDHIWEIDRTIKEISANKLMQAAEAEKVWVLWAKESEMISLRLMDLTGINILILGFDIRKLIWDRLLSERFHRQELQNALSQEERFSRARSLHERMLPESGMPG